MKSDLVNSEFSEFAILLIFLRKWRLATIADSPKYNLDEILILELIDRWPGVIPLKLTKVLDKRQSSIHDICLKLERAGLIKVEINRDDQRQKLLETTGEGKEKLSAMRMAQTFHLFEMLSEKLTTSEKMLIEEALRILLREQKRLLGQIHSGG